MRAFRPSSTSEQLVEHLRNEIREGNLSGTMPGVRQIVKEFGVNSVAVTHAMHQLENEGLVISQGGRRSRLIVKSAKPRVKLLKVGILHYDSGCVWRHDVSGVKHELSKAGHIVSDAPKSMVELDFDAERTGRQVLKMNADAWVVIAGSRQILEWFEEKQIPAFALFGRLDHVSLPGVGVNKKSVIADLIRKLVNFGHSRIVMLSKKERRVPHLGVLEQTFIQELELHGIPTGSYNIPDWEDTPDGLKEVLDSLFKYTPPTALIIGDSLLFHSVQVHLAGKGFVAPTHISLFSNDYEQSFEWGRPQVSHIEWDYRPMIRRVMQWSKHIAEGKKDAKQIKIRAKLCEGGTIGPVPRAR